jgi:hypothetical protein
MELKPCLRCKELASVVPVDLDGKPCYFVRPNRFSKCKKYPRRRKASDTCSTQVRGSEAVAITEWNKRFAEELP